MKKLKFICMSILMLFSINIFGATHSDSLVLTKFTFDNSVFDSSIYKRLYDKYNTQSYTNITFAADTNGTPNSVAVFNGNSTVNNKYLNFEYFCHNHDIYMSMGDTQTCQSYNFMFKTSNTAKQTIISRSNIYHYKSPYPVMYQFIFYTENGNINFRLEWEKIGDPNTAGVITKSCSFNYNKWNYCTYSLINEGSGLNAKKYLVFYMNGAEMWKSQALGTKGYPAALYLKPYTGQFFIGNPIKNTYGKFGSQLQADYTGYGNFIGMIDNVSVLYKPTSLAEHQAAWKKITTKQFTKYLSISTTSVTLDSTANSTGTFNIASNTDWTVSSNQTWLTVDKASGSNNGIITLTATSNTLTTPRTATITLTGTDAASKNITITQLGGPQVLRVSTTSVSINSTANSSETFNIIANIDWSAVSSQSWLSINPASGSNNETITLTATANTTTSSRTAIITLYSHVNNSRPTITITQLGTTPVLSVSTNSLSVGSVSSIKTFDITSNTSWTVSSNQTWLTVDKASGSNNETITLTAAANIGASRTATITVSGTNVANQTITFTQEAYVAPVNPGYLTIYKTTVKPTIDGSVDAMWDTTKWNNILNGKDVYTGITGKFKMCYDNDNVYLLINKTDATPNSVNSATYLSDCIELFFAMDTNNSASYRPGDWQIRKLDANTTIDGSSNISTLTTNANFKVAQTGTTDRYVEYQLPISVLKQTANFNNSWFRFDIQIGDNTGTTKVGGLFWNSNVDDQWSMVKNQGYIKLVDNTVITPTLTVDKETMSIKSDDLISTFNITSNTTWNVSSNKTWLSVNTTSGSNNKTIVLTSSTNTSASSRTATITITGTNVATKTVVLTQAGATPTLSVNKTDFTTNSSATSVSFTLSSNDSWTVSSNVSWITVSKASGTGNVSITLTIPANTSTSDRSGTITIKSTTITKTISVKQLGKTTAVESVNSDNIKFYPNPCKGMLNITTTEETNISIYDLNGKLVLVKTIFNDNQLDLSNLNDGMYIIRMNNKIEKLIIKK